MISPNASDGGQDFELNLASIIDCLTVIIAFLLLSSSFVSYGTLDTAVAAPQGQTSGGSEGQPQAVTLAVSLRDSDHVDLEVSGARTEKRRISRASLKQELESMKAKFPGLNGIVLTAAARVEYRDVIRGMDEARQVFPAVALGLGAGGSR
jgi:biopolymer transport protein ExbD